MTAVTICSDFGGQEEEINHCIHLFPFYLPYFKYADNTTFMAESEEELKGLLMKVKVESEKSCHETQHSEY